MAKTIIEEFVATLGWDVDNEDLKNFDSAVEGLGKTLKWVSGVVAGASAALGALVTATNKETAEMSNLADSVGISAENLEALYGVVKNIGFQADNVVDLVEEMSNKLGELSALGKMSSAEDSLKILNLEFKELKDLAPEEQFQKIMDAALQLEDYQQAVSALDMLMGGEANKILGFLRTQGTTLEEVTERQKELNFLTDEGRQAAVAYNHAWNQITTVFGSIVRQFSGLLGKVLTPIIDKTIDWVHANRELVKTRLKQWVGVVAKSLERLWFFLDQLYSAVRKVTDLFGGFGNSLKTIALIFASIKIAKVVSAFSALIPVIKALSFSSILSSLKFLTNPVSSLADLLVLLGLAIEDLIVYFQGGESLLGEWGEKIGEFVHTHIAGLVASLFGLSREEFDLAFVGTLYDLIDVVTVDIPQAFERMVGRVTDLFSILGDDSVSMSDKIVATLQLFRDFYYEVYSTFFLVVKKALSWVGDLFLDFADKLLPGFKAKFLGVISSIGEGIKDIFGDSINSAMRYVTAGLAKLKKLISEVPIIGSLLYQPNLESGTGGVGTASNMNVAPSSTVINQLGSQTANQSKTDVVNNFAITQRAGENGADLAERIASKMREEVAVAVRNNETGIVY